LLGRALARGAFGPTPAYAVFLPFLLWALLCIASLVYIIMFARRHRAPIHIGYITLAASFAGTVLAYLGVQGWLEVV